MSTPVKVATFVVALVAVFGTAIGVGRAVGPVDEPAAEHDTGHDDSSDGEAHTGDEAAPAVDTEVAADLPGGLMVSQNGYTLALTEQGARAGSDVPVSFTITGPDGSPVTEYDVEHEKRLHLIAVRRDFSGFQHVHPELHPDGTWSTDLDLTPGQWRLFADFKATGGEALTLGTDLAVKGGYQPTAPRGTVRTATVDGFTVTLAGDLVPGTDAELTLSVSKDGRPVTDLQPYLGAYGHLVALREGDLAYLHVHPDGTPGDGTTDPGPDVVFYAAVPSTGRYRLYLDFQHGGVVRTASFALATNGAEPATDGHAGDSGSDDSDGHSGH